MILEIALSNKIEHLKLGITSAKANQVSDFTIGLVGTLALCMTTRA